LLNQRKGRGEGIPAKEGGKVMSSPIFRKPARAAGYEEAHIRGKGERSKRKSTSLEEKNSCSEGSKRGEAESFWATEIATRRKERDHTPLLKER